MPEQTPTRRHFMQALGVGGAAASGLLPATGNALAAGDASDLPPVTNVWVEVLSNGDAEFVIRFDNPGVPERGAALKEYNLLPGIPDHAISYQEDLDDRVHVDMFPSDNLRAGPHTNYQVSPPEDEDGCSDLEDKIATATAEFFSKREPYRRFPHRTKIATGRNYKTRMAEGIVGSPLYDPWQDLKEWSADQTRCRKEAGDAGAEGGFDDAVAAYFDCRLEDTDYVDKVTTWKQQTVGGRIKNYAQVSLPEEGYPREFSLDAYSEDVQAALTEAGLTETWDSAESLLGGLSDMLNLATAYGPGETRLDDWQPKMYRARWPFMLNEDIIEPYKVRMTVKYPTGVAYTHYSLTRGEDIGSFNSAQSSVTQLPALEHYSHPLLTILWDGAKTAYDLSSTAAQQKLFYRNNFEENLDVVMAQLSEGLAQSLLNMLPLPLGAYYVDDAISWAYMGLNPEPCRLTMAMNELEEISGQIGEGWMDTLDSDLRAIEDATRNILYTSQKAMASESSSEFQTHLEKLAGYTDTFKTRAENAHEETFVVDMTGDSEDDDDSSEFVELKRYGHRLSTILRDVSHLQNAIVMGLQETHPPEGKVGQAAPEPDLNDSPPADEPEETPEETEPDTPDSTTTPPPTSTPTEPESPPSDEPTESGENFRFRFRDRTTTGSPADELSITSLGTDSWAAEKVFIGISFPSQENRGWTWDEVPGADGDGTITEGETITLSAALPYWEEDEFELNKATVHVNYEETHGTATETLDHWQGPDAPSE